MSYMDLYTSKLVICRARQTLLTGGVCAPGSGLVPDVDAVQCLPPPMPRWAWRYISSTISSGLELAGLDDALLKG